MRGAKRPDTSILVDERQELGVQTRAQECANQLETRLRLRDSTLWAKAACHEETTTNMNDAESLRHCAGLHTTLCRSERRLFFPVPFHWRRQLAPIRPRRQTHLWVSAQVNIQQIEHRITRRGCPIPKAAPYVRGILPVALRSGNRTGANHPDLRWPPAEKRCPVFGLI